MHVILHEDRRSFKVSSKDPSEENLQIRLDVVTHNKVLKNRLLMLRGMIHRSFETSTPLY